MTGLDVLLFAYFAIGFGLGMLTLWSVHAWQDHRRLARHEGENPFAAGE